MTLGEKIKHQRKMNNLSQEKVGELVGVSRQAVTRWETNQSAPSTDNLIKLAGIFKISLEQLANDNAKPTDNNPVHSRKILMRIAIVWGSILSVLIAAFLLSENLFKLPGSSSFIFLIEIMILLGFSAIPIYIIVLLIRALNKYLRS